LFCRFEKCKLQGMVHDFTIQIPVKVRNIGSCVDISSDVKEERNLCDDLEQYKTKLDSDLYFLLTSENAKGLKEIPRSFSYQIGAAEIRKLHFFVELWHMQKIVQPVGLPNILPILQSWKNKKPFPRDVEKTHNKVSL
jgi:hypothetical protein